MSYSYMAAGLRNAFTGGQASQGPSQDPPPARRTADKPEEVGEPLTTPPVVYIRHGFESPPTTARLRACTRQQELADVSRCAGQPGNAYVLYQKAAQSIVGPGFIVPIRGTLQQEVYTQLSHWERAELMACCNKIGRCMIELKNLEAALEWLEEVNIIHINGPPGSPKFDWFGQHITLFDLYRERFHALALLSNIYLELGNSSVAVQRRWLGQTTASDLPPNIDPVALRKIITSTMISEVTEMRHPDPKLVSKLDVKDERLQVRGSWQKVRIRPNGMPTARTGFASFVWNGRLYVSGGEKDVHGPYYRDLWYLDLKKLDMWRPLPPYPVPQFATGKFTGWSMAVHKDKAYLFDGTLFLPFFDLVKQTWDCLKTTYAGPGDWPYPPNLLCDYTMQLVDGRIYVFGGIHHRARIGCNLFMMLDLDTLKWRCLSGTTEPQADDNCPGPRRCATSWVSKEADKIYLMYGHADRQGAGMAKQAHAGTFGHAYDDMWTWNIHAEKWTKERIVGNLPCARAEMATTYNPKLNKLVFFGGYSPTLPTFYPESNEGFGYSYYADTFIYDFSTSPPAWKQVLTRGFPTYRAQAKLLSEPTTGKIFLFAGYTNTEYVPSRSQYISRSFGDMWQLRLDVEGGFFEGVDFDEEARTAKVGPWQRCFSCGCAGPWKKCGGTCKGHAFFCDSQCLKEGWKEHKSRHKCRKKT